MEIGTFLNLSRSMSASRKNGITIPMLRMLAEVGETRNAAPNGSCRIGWPFITNSLSKLNSTASHEAEVTKMRMNVRILLLGILTASIYFAVSRSLCAENLPLVTRVELQPLAAQVERVLQALESTGSPVTAGQHKAIRAALSESDETTAVEKIQKLLDPLCLVGVLINPESRVTVQAGPAPKELIEQGWRVFLVKVNNQAGVTAPLRCSSPNAAPLHESKNDAEPPNTISQRDVLQRWLDVGMFDSQPLSKQLSGLALEYRVVELFSRDAGKRDANLSFDVGQGTQDLGFRNEANLLFDCLPCVRVKLEVLDEDGTPTTGHFTFRDARDHVYPARSRRLAPDFFFQDQVYRQNGEEILLPAGRYHVTYNRGPEYQELERDIEIPAGKQHAESFRMKRWINLSATGWYSGDHHV